MNNEHELHGEKYLLLQSISVLEFVSRCGFILLGNAIVVELSSALYIQCIRNNVFCSSQPFFLHGLCQHDVSFSEMFSCITCSLLLYQELIEKGTERTQASVKIMHVSHHWLFRTNKLNFFSKVCPPRRSGSSPADHVALPQLRLGR